ncbi:MAG: aspartate aminotransferase family protein [Chitinophagales bacterium]|nr:aspartate aminotransferase family protein [Chitinophagales bacterium]
MEKPVCPFPDKGTLADDLLETIRAKRQRDIQWQAGRSFCLIYYPGEEREHAIKKIFDAYYADSGLNPTATPSLAELEAETVSMCASLFNGTAETCGNVTTGGTESILLAVKTARDYARKTKPHIKKPNVVLPQSAHPAFMKAFHFLEVDFIATPLNSDYSADVAAMEKAINENTIMLVGSAPAYAHGVMDNIEAIAALAKRKNLLCHVDACIGGFMLPFIKQLGYAVPPFDFSLEGVTSLSADLHKYGYAPKGSSAILYSNHELRKHQFTLYTKWNGGVYGSPTITGTRNGGCIAAAWAALKVIGNEGYMEMAAVTMQVTDKVMKAISEIPELQIISRPVMSMVSFQSHAIDVYMLADELNKRGWHFERQQLPPSLHFTFNYIHHAVADEFIADLKACVEAVKDKRLKQLGNKVQTAAVKGLSKILPAGTLAKFNKAGAEEIDNENKAAMYGMMGALSGTDDLEKIVLDFLDNIYTAKPNK